MRLKTTEDGVVIQGGSLDGMNIRVPAEELPEEIMVATLKTERCIRIVAPSGIMEEAGDAATLDSLFAGLEIVSITSDVGQLCIVVDYPLDQNDG